MRPRTWIAFLLVGFGPLAGAAAQQPSLAEVARQEAERRQTVKSTSKVYTNDDVKKAADTPISVVAAAPSAAGEAASKPAEGQAQAAATQPKAAPGEPAKDEAYWRKRATDAQEQLQRSRLFAEALQSRINALTTDFVARDDPYQRQQIAQQRQEALAELDRIHRDIEAQTKAIEDLEEEARRSGVPAGWLR
jgi:hypothetical protein